MVNLELIEAYMKVYKKTILPKILIIYVDIAAVLLSDFCHATIRIQIWFCKGKDKSNRNIRWSDNVLNITSGVEYFTFHLSEKAKQKNKYSRF